MTVVEDNFLNTYDDFIVIYLKLEDFSLIEDFYDAKILYRIQKEVREYLEKKLQNVLKTDSKLSQLHSGGYVLTIDKKSLNISSINHFISTIKNFQKFVEDRILTIDEVQYQVSVLISLVFDGNNRYESAKIGIKELVKNNRSFIIANNLSKLRKEKIQENIDLLNTIKFAIKNSSVIPYFQPIIDSKSKEVVRYEALMRIVDENGRVLTPYNFLEVSKTSRHYYRLTQSILQKSFKQVRDKNIELSINLSIRDIESSLIRKIIYNLLKKYSKVAHKISFELLEDESIKDLKTISNFIKKVKEYGVKIAIDDFGTGFSNFERLLYYKPDLLKIDGILIKDIKNNSYSKSIVKTIVSFAKEQGIHTVAEFVEDREIFECVKELGIDYAQGYFFGKPKEHI